MLDFGLGRLALQGVRVWGEMGSVGSVGSTKEIGGDNERLGENFPRSLSIPYAQCPIPNAQSP